MQNASHPSSRSGELDRPSRVRMARSEVGRGLGRQVMRSLGALIVGVAVLYLCFASTIMRVVPTTDAGMVPVKNVTARGGVVKPGTVLLASTTKAQGKNFIDRLSQSLLPQRDTVKIRVVAGPFGKVASNGGINTVDGRPVGLKLDSLPEGGFLENQYIGQCLEGDCSTGSGVVINQDNILGEVLTKKAGK